MSPRFALAAGLVFAVSPTSCPAEEQAIPAFECRVDDPGVFCFGGAAWRREKDNELTLLGVIGWNAKNICDTWPWVARADPSLRIS